MDDVQITRKPGEDFVYIEINGQRAAYTSAHEIEFDELAAAKFREVFSEGGCSGKCHAPCDFDRNGFCAIGKFISDEVGEDTLGVKCDLGQGDDDWQQRTKREVSECWKRRLGTGDAFIREE